MHGHIVLLVKAPFHDAMPPVISVTQPLSNSRSSRLERPDPFPDVLWIDTLMEGVVLALDLFVEQFLPCARALVAKVRHLV